MKKSRAVLVIATLAFTGAVCNKQEAAAPPAPPSPAPAASSDARALPAPEPRSVSGTNTVKGTVKLEGTLPQPKMIRRETDPFCARKQLKEEDVIVNAKGGIKNVLIRITKGISGNYDPPMTNGTLDQVDCMYRPRVQAIMAGQSLLIRNSDQTLHNVHSYKGASTIFNQAQVPGLPPMAKKFNDVGDIIKFKCDVHPWMTGYVAIVNHPFFAVTGDDGTFSIPKVPAGKYTLEAWHERYGVNNTEIAVTPDKPSEIAIAFQAK